MNMYLSMNESLLLCINDSSDIQQQARLLYFYILLQPVVHQFSIDRKIQTV